MFTPVGVNVKVYHLGVKVNVYPCRCQGKNLCYAYKHQILKKNMGLVEQKLRLFVYRRTDG